MVIFVLPRNSGFNLKKKTKSWESKKKNIINITASITQMLGCCHFGMLLSVIIKIKHMVKPFGPHVRGNY